MLSGIADRVTIFFGPGVEDVVEVEAVVETADVLVPCRPALLPNRNRGTRVCIFCSRFLTRARISETIWTPLLLDAIIGMAVTFVDALELAVTMVGRETGAKVRGELRDAARVGRVLERVIDEGDGVIGLLTWKPTRWSRTDCPTLELTEVEGGQEGVEIEESSSEESSESWRSGGGGVLSKFSSVETVERDGKSEGVDVEVEVSVSMSGALEREADNWFLRIEISTDASGRRASITSLCAFQ